VPDIGEVVPANTLKLLSAFKTCSGVQNSIEDSLGQFSFAVRLGFSWKVEQEFVAEVHLCCIRIALCHRAIEGRRFRRSASCKTGR
jgi:hypothetical protein